MRFRYRPTLFLMALIWTKEGLNLSASQAIGRWPKVERGKAALWGKQTHTAVLFPSRALLRTSEFVRSWSSFWVPGAHCPGRMHAKWPNLCIDIAGSGDSQRHPVCWPNFSTLDFGLKEQAFGRMNLQKRCLLNNVLCAKKPTFLGWCHRSVAARM